MYNIERNTPRKKERMNEKRQKEGMNKRKKERKLDENRLTISDNQKKENHRQIQTTFSVHVHCTFTLVIKNETFTRHFQLQRYMYYLLYRVISLLFSPTLT